MDFLTGLQCFKQNIGNTAWQRANVTTNERLGVGAEQFAGAMVHGENMIVLPDDDHAGLDVSDDLMDKPLLARRSLTQAEVANPLRELSHQVIHQFQFGNAVRLTRDLAAERQNAPQMILVSNGYGNVRTQRVEFARGFLIVIVGRWVRRLRAHQNSRFAREMTANAT